MARGGADVRPALASTSPNRLLDPEQSNHAPTKRFEIQDSATSRPSPAPTNVNMPNVSLMNSQSRPHPQSPSHLPDSTLMAPSTGIRIPGFDPSKYGKPKLLPERVKAQTYEHATPRVAESSIHSPAVTFSTLDESGPVTPHLTSTLPTSEDSTALPRVRLQPPSTRSLSPLPSHLAQLDSADEKEVTIQSNLRIQPEKAESFVNDTAVSTETQVTVTSPLESFQRPTSPLLSPRTQGRPRSNQTSAPTANMNQPAETQHRFGRPFPVSNVPVNGQENPQQKLQRLKLNELNSINRRNRRKDKEQTASPATLSALRLPLAPEKERTIAARIQHYLTIGATPSPTQSVVPRLAAPLPDTLIQSVSQPAVINSTAPHPAFSKSDLDQTSTSTPDQTQAKLGKQPYDSTTERSSDYYVPSHARKAPHPRNPRWVTNEEIRPEEVSDDSNAWGSADADEVSTDSNDSVIAVHHGKFRQKRAEPTFETNLVGWDGKMQPPPIDWCRRPMFDNNNPDNKATFNRWTDAVLDRTLRPKSPDVSFECIDIAKVGEVSNHPDGIGMVPRKTTITVRNAAHYGYAVDIAETTRDSKPLTSEELNQVIIIDTRDPANEHVLEETTESIVQRWIAHNDIQFDSLLRAMKETTPAPKVEQVHKNQRDPNSPKISIYLRPAVATDMLQVTRIYNWHIENGPRTAEYDSIPESDMRGRFRDVTDSKLPFIVAVLKVKRRSKRGRNGEDEIGTHAANRPTGVVKNTNPEYTGMNQEEKIVGWACAQDLTASDYVERISAELEVYVAPDAQRQGVAQCLMDKLLDACDRGYLKRGGYDFDCAPEMSYLYNGGGGRDLHKLYFLLRTWSKPRKAVSVPGQGKGVAMRSELRRTYQSEDEGGEWLKEWLERWDFKEEGNLRQAGARKGKYLDIIHLGRETFWNPADGQIPDALPGTE